MRRRTREPQQRASSSEVRDVLRIRARKLYGYEAGYVEALAAAFLKIRDKDGALADLHPNPVQCKYARTRSARNIILKARQTGLTTFIAARYFISTVTVPGTVTLQVAHSLESAQQIFRIVHRYFEHLPPAWHKYLRVNRSTVRELAFAATDSRYIVDTAGNPNAGRGLTIHNLHASEVALWPGNPQETMAALLAAVPPGGTVDLESTPNGAGGYFYEEYLRAKSGNGFTPHFFPWWAESAYRRALAPHETLEPMDDSERFLVETKSLKPEQINYRRWLREQFGALAPQEYAESDAECFLLSGRPVFEISKIESRLRELPPWQHTADNGAELIWFEPEPGRNYVIGADVAEGKERGDWSAAVVVDVAQGLQCAERLSKSNLHEFARALDRLGRRYNTALLAVERNNHGHAILQTLEHELHYPRIYRHAAGSSSGTAAAAAPYGWPTNAQTKPQAIQTLARMLREAPQVFASRRLLEQCRSYSHDDSGGTSALSGSHDDLVMAAAIAFAVRECSPMPQLLAFDRVRH